MTPRSTTEFEQESCDAEKFNYRTIILIVSSLFMAGHWITYFYALKLSNVAIGMLSLYTFPVMIAFLEPVFLKVKFNPICFPLHDNTVSHFIISPMKPISAPFSL